MPVRVLLPTGFGINCEAETEHAFSLVGAEVDRLHLNDVLDRPSILARARILALAGGFSFGDHLGAGRALANRLRCRLADDLDRFIGDGGVVLGVCNGFQTMVRLGLLPAGRPGPQTVTLTTNRHGAFYDGWITLSFDPRSPCVFTRGLDRLEVPVRHGEGRLIIGPAARTEIAEHHLGVCRYADPATGTPTDRFPHDPNGSDDQLAGLCDPSGRIFGLMPHPEAFLYRESHPRWRSDPAPQTLGVEVFRNAVRFCAGE